MTANPIRDMPRKYKDKRKSGKEVRRDEVRGRRPRKGFPIAAVWVALQDDRINPEEGHGRRFRFDLNCTGR